MIKKLAICGLGIALSGCFQPMKPSPGHIEGAASTAPAASIPPPVQALPVPPKPRPAARVETYSVVVNNVNVRELLFALARDAKVNVDIHPGITGTVTLNAIDQTLPQLLSRLAKQVDMRYELDGPNLVVMPDSPYLRVYKIDYVNMDRQMTGSVQVTGRIAGATGGAGGAAGAAGGAAAGGGAGAGGGGTSNVAISNRSNNRFWETLQHNVEQILRDTDKILPTALPGAAATPVALQQGAQPPGAAAPGAGPGGAQPAAAPNVMFREAASVIANPEASVLTVRASARQHEKIQEFLDQVLVNARRQVLIETTIVEVALSNGYQQGIDFNILRQGSAGISGGIIPQGEALIATPRGSFFSLAYTSASFLANLKLLETFGKVRVLSSPRVSVINNQTAILKVVESVVYFQVSSNTSQAQTTSLTSFTTTAQSVDVGVVLNVTPQISENDAVLLNLKPSVTSVTSFVDDPNPSLRNPCGTNITGNCNIAPILNRVPQVATREMESVLRLTSGQIAVMGGLIQDRVEDNSDTVPGVNRVPIIGDIFQSRVAASRKVELVIFLRPVVIRDPSLDGDYRGYRVFAPGEDFLSQPNPAKRPCDFRVDAGCPQ